MDNQKQIRKLKAFTFIELSITIVVIAIIGFVVLRGGNSLVNSSAAARARSLTVNSPVTKIDGLVAWYETTLPDSFIASEASDGRQVTEWRDVSPASIVMRRNTLTRTADNQVVYVKNGISKLPSINFSGTGRFVTTFAQGNVSTPTIFIVFSSIGYWSNGTTVLLDGKTYTKRLAVAPDYVRLTDGSSGASTTTVTNSFIANTPYMLAVYFNLSNSKVYSSDANTPFGGLLNITISAIFEGITLGDATGGGNNIRGMISEVIIYNRPLNISERKAVMGYLSKKYKISVTGL